MARLDDASRSSVDLRGLVSSLTTELGTRTGSHWTSVDGSMLSADVTGFTALSEELASQGKAGAERINALMSSLFTGLIATVNDNGGEVLKFGGDAILVCFRGSGHAARAGATALRMQHHLATFRSGRSTALQMRIGVADGPFDAFLVGSVRRELFICGANASSVIELEAACRPGAVLTTDSVAAQTAAALSDRTVGGLALGVATVAEPPLASGPDDVDVTPFVSAQVLNQLDAIADLGGEHRIVTAGFVEVSGIDQLIENVGRDEVCASLAEVVDLTRSVCARSGVAMLDSDIAVSGVKLMLAAGAPTTSGHDEDSMLEVGLTIVGMDTPFDIRVAVHRGRAFAGLLGSKDRLTYTVMGDTVNTTARLLGHVSPGQIVATNEVLEHTAAGFEAERLGTTDLRGRAAAVDLWRVDEVSATAPATSGSHRLLGREVEVRRVITGLHRERLLVIEGVAGVGKSSLLSSVLDDLDHLRVVTARCTPMDVERPFGAARLLLRQIIGLNDDSPAEQVDARLRSLVGTAMDAASWRALSIAVGLTRPGASEKAAQTIEQDRAAITAAAVQLITEVSPAPLLFAVDDAQWLDDASGSLIEAVCHVASQCSVLATRRPSRNGGHTDVPLADAHVVVLDPLPDEVIRELVIDHSEAPRSDADLAAIVRRAGGNPHFAVLLAEAVEVGDDSELPTTIEQVLADRIDRLDPPTRRFVRLAAVLGVSMTVSELDAVVDALGVDVPDRDADFGGVIVRSQSSWEFAGSALRDAAYEGLPFATRQRLHRVVGDTLEARAEEPERIADRLSLHFAQAAVPDKAWKYSVLAGRSAVADAALVEAAAAFGRGIAAVRRRRSTPPDALASTFEQYADVLTALGRYPEARDAYAAARRANADDVTEVDLMRKLGVLNERRDDLSAAVRWFGKARRLAERARSNGREDRLASVRALVELGDAGVRFRRREFARCWAMASAALDAAEHIGDEHVQGLALDRRHISGVYLRRSDAGADGERAQRILAAVGDRTSLVRLLNNRGVEAYFEDRWSDAAEFYRLSMEEGMVLGNVVEASLAALNTGEILSDQGRWEEADELLRNALRAWSAAGYATGIAAAELFIGVNLVRQNEIEAGRRSLHSARDRIVELGLGELGTVAETRLLEADAANGRFDPETIDVMLAHADVDGANRSRLTRLRARWLAASGRLAEAVDLLRADIDEATESEQALSIELLVTLAPSVADASTLQQRLRSIHAKLGIVATPQVLSHLELSGRIVNRPNTVGSVGDPS